MKAKPCHSKDIISRIHKNSLHHITSSSRLGKKSSHLIYIHVYSSSSSLKYLLQFSPHVHNIHKSPLHPTTPLISQPPISSKHEQEPRPKKRPHILQKRTTKVHIQKPKNEEQSRVSIRPHPFSPTNQPIHPYIRPSVASYYTPARSADGVIRHK